MKLAPIFLLGLFVLEKYSVECQAVEEEEKVKVFSLQKGLWKVPSNDVFLRYNFSRKPTEQQQPLMEFSICYRLKFESFAFRNIHVSYATSDLNSNAIMLYNVGNTYKSWLNDVAILKKEWKGYPDIWYHMCNLYNETTYTVYRQGKEFFSGDLEMQLPLHMNGTLIIGQEQDSISGGFDSHQIFRGDITQIDIWNRGLLPTEVLDLASCKKIAIGNVFSSSEQEFEVFGDITEMQIPLSHICKHEPYYIVLPEERTFASSLPLCHRLNGTLAIPTSAKENDVLHRSVIPFIDKCSPTVLSKFWLGITDEIEEGVWRTVDTGDIVTYLNFGAAFTSTTTFMDCAAIMGDGLWDEANCDPVNKKCSACHIENSDFLILRGFCFDTEHQSRFRPNGYVNGRLLFRGYYYYVIMWEDEDLKWILRNTATNLTVAWLPTITKADYPLGRQEWYLKQTLCEKAPGEALSLSLSPCSAYHFTCHSGDCISSNLRCNLGNDCDDGSDEDGCDMLILPGGYRHHLAPTGQKIGILMLKAIITIKRIASVDELKQSLTIEFEVKLAWRDGRLNFRHLESRKKGSLLSQEEASKIWKPEYRITNLDGGLAMEVYKALIIEDMNNATLPGFNSVNNDKIYPGSENEVKMIQNYVATFTCSFELYFYPFDIQQCSIDITLPDDYSDRVQFSTVDSDVKYTGKEELPLFAVRKAKFSTSEEGDRLQATFELHRRQGVAIMSNFLPSVLLLLVSWATLFVQMEALNVRAIMSLTTLLVLYTLFAQLSSSLPKTAAIKLIDIWFFFIIFLLFSNIMVHIFAGYLGSSSSSVSQVQPQLTTKNRFIAWGKGVQWPLSEKFLVYQRCFILPLAFIIFNIIFWLQVLQR